jgi:uncharacterized protein YndB with AHSA1/START domain
MARYKFIDHWNIQAPIEQVFRYVADPRTYPQWWPVYDKAEVLPGVQPPDVGSRSRLTVKSVLGYRLHIEVETTESDPPYYLDTVSNGDLEGTGTWEFKQDGDTTTATWAWIVESHHPLLNLLEPVAKKLFEWSHNDASEKGHRGLKQLLEGKTQQVEQEAILAGQSN